MKKIWLIIFILSLPFVFSLQETSIYSGEVLDGATIEADDGKKFKFRFDFASKQAMVESSYGSWFIPEHECEVRNNIDICISNITFAYRNVSTIIDVYQSNVKIYTVTAELEATHSLAPQELLSGERIKGVLSLENVADMAAEKVSVRIAMPDNLQLLSSEGCTLNGNRVEMSTTISPSKKIICYYDALAMLSGEFTIKANISYFDGIDTVEEIASASAEVLPPSLKIRAENISMESGTKMSLNISLENTNEDYNLQVGILSVNVPLAFSITKKPLEMKVSGNKITWSGPLEMEESKNLTIELEAKKVGTHSISVDASYSENNLARKSQLVFPIKVNCTCPTIEESNGEVYLLNPNPVQSFRDIKATLDGIIKQFPSVAPGSHLVLGKSATEVTVEFVSEQGEGFSITKNPAQETYEDAQESPEVDEEGDEPEEDASEEEEEQEDTSEEDRANELANAQKTDKNQTSNVTIINEVVTELQKPISTKVIMIGGIIAGSIFLIVTFLVLKRKRVQKVGGRTLEDIDKELRRLEKGK